MTVWELSSKQLGYVQLITGLAVGNGLGRRAAVYAVACSGAEASLMNWENDGRSTHVARGGKINGRQLNAAERVMCRRSRGLGDGIPPWGDNLDSMGLFAQRPLEGWGEPEQIMQPEFATKAFLGRLAAVKGWADMPAAEVIRRVQGYHSDIYTDWLATADAVVPSSSTPTTPGKDWLTMVTEQEFTDALDDLAEKTADEVAKGPLLRVTRLKETGVDYAWGSGCFFKIRDVQHFQELYFAGIVGMQHGETDKRPTEDQVVMKSIREFALRTAARPEQIDSIEGI